MSEVKSREPLTKETLKMIARTLSPVALMVIGFNPKEIDLEFGAGIIDNTTKCIWKKDGIRLTFSMGVGAFTASGGKDPDPYYMAERANAV